MLGEGNAYACPSIEQCTDFNEGQQGGIVKIKDTRTLNPDDRSEIHAELHVQDGKVWLHREGASQAGLIEVDPEFYKFSSSRSVAASIRFPSIILYVSNRCNLNCPLCYEGADSPDEEPRFEELLRVADSFPRQTMMVLGGREPTCRDDLPEMIAALARRHPVRLLTNGIRLGEAGYAAKLKRAGLGGVSLSLNGLNEEVHLALNGRPLLQEKLRAVDQCAREGLTCVLSMVLARGLNEDQLVPMIRYGLERNEVIDSLFVRSAVPIGREAIGEPFCLSEMVQILADQLHEPLDPFLDEMHLMASVFDNFGVERCRPRTCATELHVRRQAERLVATGRSIPPWAGRAPLQSKAATVAAVLQTYGLRYPLGQLSLLARLPFKRRLHSHFRISLRAWPCAGNLDLEENRKCATGYYRDGKLAGFCRTNTASCIG